MTALKLVHSAQQETQKRDYINRIAMNEPKTGVFFSDFVRDTIIRKSKRMGNTYIKNYSLLIKHINSFSEKYDVNLYTNSINEEFLDDFIIYLQEQKLKQGYIKYIIALAKSMVKKAGTYGYAVDPSYDDIVIDEDDSFAVYLTLNEITRIYYYKGLTRKQEQIRDLFVVGCLTGLRYSDYSSLISKNFQGDYIVKVTKKTGKKVIIPLHDYVHEIYQKYNGEVSKGLTIQHFNRYIKKICNRVGLDEKITFNYTRGGQLITEQKEKWELISSHTARRSAATNMYLTGRMKTFEIMAITGHTTEKSFFRYIRTTTEDKAKQISTDVFFKK